MFELLCAILFYHEYHFALNMKHMVKFQVSLFPCPKVF